MLPDIQIENTVSENEEEIVVPSDGHFSNAVIMLQPGGKFRIRMALEWIVPVRL
jgi:hypothetical protein